MTGSLKKVWVTTLVGLVAFAGCTSDAGEAPEPESSSVASPSTTPPAETQEFPVRYNVWDDTKENPISGATELVVPGADPWFPHLGRADAKLLGSWTPGTIETFTFYPDGRDGTTIEVEIAYDETDPRPTGREKIDVVIFIKDDFVKVETGWARFTQKYPRFP